MKLVMSHNELYQAVSKLLGISSHSTGKVLFYPKDESEILLIAGNASTVLAAVSVSASIDSFDTASWIEIGKLYSFLNAIHTTPNITIVQAGNKWKFAIGESSFTSAIQVGDYFHLAELPDTKPIIIKSSEVDNLSRVATLSAKDRGFYSGTYVVISGKHMTCLATDGFGAGIVWFDTDKVLEQRQDFFIPSDALLELRKSLNADSDVLVYTDANKVHFVSDNFRLITSEIADKQKFPADNIAKALRSDLIDGVECPIVDLTDKLQACSTIRDKDHNNALRVKIESEEESLVVTSYDNVSRMKMLVPVIRHFGERQLSFDINPKYIQTATNLLKQIGDTSNVYIHDVESLNWVFITANSINGRFSFAKMHPQE